MKTVIGLKIGADALRKARELARRFEGRDYLAVTNKDDAEAALRERHLSEYTALAPYADSRKTRVCIAFGLRLRAKAEKGENVDGLRSDIYRKHGAEGLHLAQAAQEGMLNLIVQDRIGTRRPAVDVERELRAIFSNIDRHVAFVKTEDDLNVVAQEILSKMRSFSPSIFVVAGSGTAKELVRQIVHDVKQGIRTHDIVARHETRYVYAAVFSTGL